MNKPIPNTLYLLLDRPVYTDRVKKTVLPKLPRKTFMFLRSFK